MIKSGRILKRFPLKYQAKLEFFQNVRLKNFTRQMPVILEKYQSTNVNFLMNFVRSPLQELDQKMFFFVACLQEKSNHRASGFFLKLTRTARYYLSGSGPTTRNPLVGLPVVSPLNLYR
jgi:hypothetical protein